MAIPDYQPRPVWRRNERLFADHFLDNALPRHGEWAALVPAAESAMAAIAAIVARHAGKESEHEAQTERGLVQPVLELLGHVFEVQPALQTPGGTHKPDYVFYRTEQDRHAQRGQILTDELLSGTAYAVGDAKHWDRPLDSALRRTGGDPFSNRNPSYQISFYLQHSGLVWGILTNGRLWRLYHRSSAHKLDQYYEIDLPAVVATGDPTALLYFYAFFRREAFFPGPLGLDTLLHQSLEHTRGVGENLRNQVYLALRCVAQGFLDVPGQGLATDQASLTTIYDNALIVLYRLLFAFYAEARDVLPLRSNQLYRTRYSLDALKRNVARKLDDGQVWLPDSSALWARLLDLFRHIDRGSARLGVAAFNGGLFDPDHHPFLVRYRVGDQRLQQAIDMLARIDDQFVDYRELDVRHLGTIYEGLLEYQLVPAEPNEEWTIDLVNDRGERKATGSYYTPDELARFMVDAALNPALAAAVAGKTSDAATIESVLAIGVLDPAMGSGHFLVEATERIAQFLVDLGVTPDGAAVGEADVAYWKRRVVQSCIYGVDRNPLAVDLAKLALWLATVSQDRPLSFLDHHLRAGDALVGAQLGHLAPGQRESGAGGRPRRAVATGELTQLPLLDDEGFRQGMSTAVDSMWLIEGSAAETLADIREQERLYEHLRASLVGRYGRLADLSVAGAFGLGVDRALWAQLADHVVGRAAFALPQLERLLAEAATMALAGHYFHWELEFPEVFFDRRGLPLGEQAGFDVVLGNPPYIRQERVTALKPYLEQRFRTYHGAADLYLYFYELGLRVLRPGGHLAFVSSGTFARANFAAKFRALLPGLARVDALIDFGENQPFRDAEMVRPTIMVLEKTDDRRPFRALFLDNGVPASLAGALTEHGRDCEQAVLQQPEWTFHGADDARLAARLLASGRPLAEVVDGRIYRGVLTGLNEAFVVDTPTRDRLVRDDPSSATLLRPLLQGEDLRPWYQEDEGRWLIGIANGWTRLQIEQASHEEEAWRWLRERHPSLVTHLQPFAERARQRQDKGEYWWELRPCSYYGEFAKPKIIWPDIAKLPRFSYDGQGLVMANTGYILPTTDMALLGILQSRAIWFVISRMCQPLRRRAGLWQYRLLPQYMERLPIPSIDPATRESLAAIALTMATAATTRYALHRRVRHRLLSDLAPAGRALNQHLTAWWTLDFPSLRAELHKAFRSDIPVRDRDEWEAWLTAQHREHERLTAEIVRHETELNARVYTLFDLSPEEIAIIETSTKYAYGEV